MSPILSVLIPTRNRAHYVRYAIESALNIPSDQVEVIVSENHGSDNGYDVCQSFDDPRLTVLRPDRPLPMHEHWEFMMDRCSGRWVTFIGDDDGVMPHAVDQLQYISEQYPQAEAIVSPRAYYFWDGCQEDYGDQCMSFEFRVSEKWRDSKVELKRALDQELDYVHLPQMYSGGFQRRSLIQRIRRSQNGKYFQSVTPDAYSALMSVLHTYRFLETGVPMTWVGSSPHRLSKSTEGNAKDRYEDFFGFHSDEVLTTHYALGDMQHATFGIFFLESYLSAFPATDYRELSVERIRKTFLAAVEQFRSSGRDQYVAPLAVQFGFEVPPLKNPKRSISNRLATKITKVKRKLRRSPNPNLADFHVGLAILEQSNQRADFPTISSADHLLQKAYHKWCSHRGRTMPSSLQSSKTASNSSSKAA